MWQTIHYNTLAELVGGWQFSTPAAIYPLESEGGASVEGQASGTNKNVTAEEARPHFQLHYSYISNRVKYRQLIWL